METDDTVSDSPGRSWRTVGPRASWATVLLAALLSAAVLVGLGVDAGVEPDASANLPVDAESFDAARFDAELNPDSIASAVVVFSRGGDQLSTEDLDAVEQRGEELLADVPAEAREAPSVADDDGAVLLRVPLSQDAGDPATFVNDLRRESAQDLPDGVTAEVTGGVAVTEDVTAASSGGAAWLLVGLVALLAVGVLTWIGRHPLLWAIGAVLLAVADRVVERLVALATQALPFVVDSTTGPITSLLVIGVGAGQTVVIAAAYRAALAEFRDHHAAMRAALTRCALAAAAAGGAAIAALLALLLASNPATQAVGYAGAIGVLVVTGYTVLVLPAASTLAGRRVLWPGTTEHASTPSPGAAVVPGALASRRALVVAVGAVLVVALATPLFGAGQGLTQAQQFDTPPDSILGQRTVAEHFPAGEADFTIVTAPEAEAETVADAVQRVEGVARVEEGGTGQGMVVLDASVDEQPGSEAAQQTIRDVRAAVADIDGEVLVGGIDAEALDARDAAVADQLLLLPIVVAMALAVLMGVTRSVVAPGVVIGALVAAYVVALGVGWVLIGPGLGFAAFDLRVPLLGLVVLLALVAPSTWAIVSVSRLVVPVVGLGLLSATVATVVAAQPVITLAQVGVVVAVGVLVHAVIMRGLLELGVLRPSVAR